MIVTRLFALTLSLGSVLHVLAAPAAAPKASANNTVSNPSTGAQSDTIPADIQKFTKDTTASIQKAIRKVSITAVAPGRNQKILLNAANDLKTEKDKLLGEAEVLKGRIFSDQVPKASQEKNAEALVTAINSVMKLFPAREADIKKVADLKTEEGKQAVASIDDAATKKRVTTLLAEIVAQGGGFGKGSKTN